MTATAYQTVGSPPEIPAPAKVEVRMPRWQSSLLAVGTLAVVAGVGLGLMIAGGVVIHAFKPTRHVDIFAAVHNMWVVGVLLAIAVLWLLPPHPWAKRATVPRSQEHPAKTAGRTEDGGGGASTVREEVPGPGPVPRPAEDGVLSDRPR